MNNESKFVNDFRILLRKPFSSNPSEAKPSAPLPDRMKGNVNSFLYSKYSSSQNYYYSKEINNIIAGNRTPSAIRFIDFICIDENDDLLKRYYQIKEYPIKIALLTEYYKFHEDVPRFFIMPIAHVVYNFYDKKRRINYIKITRMLKGAENCENINIHDTEINSTFNRGISNNPSLLNVLPSDLKLSLNRRNSSFKMRTVRLESSQHKETSSVTVNELNEFLAEVFKKPPNMSARSSRLHISIHEKQETHDFFEDSAFMKKTLQPLGEPKLSDNLKRKDTTKLKFMNKEKLFIKNNNLKNIMVKKLNNDGFLKALARNVIFKQQTMKQEQTATISNKPSKKQNSQPRMGKDENSKRIQNLNINNLNININFNSVSTKNLTKGKSSELNHQFSKCSNPKKDVLLSFKNEPENSLPKKTSLNEHMPLTRLDSPTYSLLQKFKSDLKAKDFGVQNGSNEAKKSTKLSQNPKSKQVLTETLAKLQFRKKVSAEKIFEVPSQNLNSLNIQFKNAIKDKIRNLHLDQKASSHSRQPTKARDVKMTSQEVNLEESYQRKENKKNGLLSNKATLQNIRLISNLKSKKNYKSSRLEAMSNNKINIFLSQDASEVRKKSSFDRVETGLSRPTIRATSDLAGGKRAHKTLELNRVSNFYNLFEDPHQFSINKYTTISNSGKGIPEDPLNLGKKYQTINYMNLFSKKNSIPDNKIKTNIENSLKGGLIRKNKQEELAAQPQRARKKPEE